MQYQLYQNLPLLHVLTCALSSVQCYHVCRFMWAALQLRCRWFCHKVPALPCYSCSRRPESVPICIMLSSQKGHVNAMMEYMPLGLAHSLEIHLSWWVVWVAHSLWWLSSIPCVDAPQSVERCIQADSGSGCYTTAAVDVPGQVWCMWSSSLPPSQGTPLAARGSLALRSLRCCPIASSLLFLHRFAVHGDTSSPGLWYMFSGGFCAHVFLLLCGFSERLKHRAATTPILHNSHPSAICLFKMSRLF